MSVGEAGETLARIAPVVDLEAMAKTRIAIIGLGTGGSRIATELARCGVGAFDLFDPQTLSLSNVSRHIGGVSDVGRLKVDVVADAIRNINPKTEVGAHTMDVLAEAQRARPMLSTASFIVDATGRSSTGHFVARLGHELAIPSAHGGVYARGVGGYVLRVRPGTDDPCYTCIFTKLKALEQNQGLNPRQIGSYSEANSPDELIAEPSLSLHVWYVALLQTRAILETITRGAAVVAPLPGSFILWANDPWGGIFPKPLSYKIVLQARSPDCVSCSTSLEQRVAAGGSS